MNEGQFEHHCATCNGVDPTAALFSPDRFIPRGECGAWDLALLDLYAHASLSITGAYVAIGALLMWVAARIVKWHRANPGNASRTFARTIVETLADVQLALVLWTYGAFILFCGLGHLEGLIAFSIPLYHAFAVWHAATALVSWWAVVVTWRLAFRIVARI